jgi:hypothetical protein
LKKANHDHHDSDDDQDVDERSEVVVIGTPETKTPHEDEQNDDGFEHGESPSAKDDVSNLQKQPVARVCATGR